MFRQIHRYSILLLLLAVVSLLHAEDFAQRKVYECTWATDALSTPAQWVHSKYYNNPQFKEARFMDYDKDAAASLVYDATIQRGGGEASAVAPDARETSFYMVYRADGLYVYFQSNEPEMDTNGKPKDSQLEIYVIPGLDAIPYYQMIVSAATGEAEYFDWQTVNRHYRPLTGSMKFTSEQVPGGWGTVMYLPWEAVYDKLPLNGESWRFSVMRWSPSSGTTWGGQVHETGRFNLIHFQPPTPEQRMAIQKYVLAKAWQQFQTTSKALTDNWQTNPATCDKVFYRTIVAPLIAQYTAQGTAMDKLAQLNATETAELFSHVSAWMELRFTVEDQYMAYQTKQLMQH